MAMAEDGVNLRTRRVGRVVVVILRLRGWHSLVQQGRGWVAMGVEVVARTSTNDVDRFGGLRCPDVGITYDLWDSLLFARVRL